MSGNVVARYVAESQKLAFGWSTTIRRDDPKGAVTTGPFWSLTLGRAVQRSDRIIGREMRRAFRSELENVDVDLSDEALEAWLSE